MDDKTYSNMSSPFANALTESPPRGQWGMVRTVK